MHHPKSRAERRHNGEVWRDRQRRKMRSWRTFSREGLEPAEYWKDNRMWWARKQSSAHGNRCMCHIEKTCRKSIRKRRRALDQEIANNLASWDFQYSIT